MFNIGTESNLYYIVEEKSENIIKWFNKVEGAKEWSEKNVNRGFEGWTPRFCTFNKYTKKEKSVDDKRNNKKNY